MFIATYSDSQLTAINIDISKKSAHIGVLIVEPTEKETFNIQDREFYLIDELIGQNTIKVALENDFTAVEEDS